MHERQDASCTCGADGSQRELLGDEDACGYNDLGATAGGRAARRRAALPPARRRGARARARSSLLGPGGARREC